MLVAREVMVADPGASRKALTDQANKAVKAVETTEGLDHAKVCQARVNSTILWKMMQQPYGLKLCSRYHQIASSLP